MSDEGRRTATAGPLSGVYGISSFVDSFRALHSKGLDRGDAPGENWKRFSYRYRVKRGMMTIVTGIPASGKSEFVDAMFVNLAHEAGWKFAIFSPENYPLELHAAKIAEKYVGCPFHDPLLPSRSMSREDVLTAMDFIGEHFTWIYPDDEVEPVSLDVILTKAKAIHDATGIDGLLLDPWNEIEVNRGGMSETDFISACLTKVRRWARKNNIHVWIVVHPTKLPKNKDGGYDPPTPYDITGSANWRNKADFCLCVHRKDFTKNEVLVLVQKVKFKHLGQVGYVVFDYEYKSGRYTEVAE